jgi:hypothetical protein
MIAWLITVVPSPTEEVVTILNYRCSSRTVGQTMERLYLERFAGLAARLRYAKNGETRYPYRLTVLNKLPCSDELWCGGGDRLFRARKVDNLKVTTTSHGSESLMWMERARPDLRDIAEIIGR